MTRQQDILDAFEAEGPDMVATSCESEKHTDSGLTCWECQACEQAAEFSWSSCELCGFRLGGSRHAVAKIFPGTDQASIYYSVCVDCYVFAANGDLPEDN